MMVNIQNNLLQGLWNGSTSIATNYYQKSHNTPGPYIMEGLGD